MPKTKTTEKTRKDKQVLLVVNIAHILNFISKETAGKILKKYKKVGDLFNPTEYMLGKRYVSKPNLVSLKKTLGAFETIQEDTRFGTLCLAFKFLTPGNLELALKEQKLLSKDGRLLKLGDILAQAGLISSGQSQLVLIKQKTHLRTQLKNSGEKKEAVKTPKINIEDMRKIKTDNLIFSFSYDALNVYLQKTDQFDPLTSIDKLKKITQDQGILHGIANDNNLNNFLDSDKFVKKEYFPLARGDAPIKSIDAVKKIYFKEEYKEAGKIEIDGSIDYKERGIIPVVNKGDLVAEKIPAKDGEAGINVFDQIISPEPPQDIVLKSGTGTELSEDGLKIYALANGYPKKSKKDEIIVNEIFIINGDVDYETGHVKYDESVKISGSVKNGFIVNAVDIVVDEVDGGILNAKGNVIIKKGAIDAKITARGHVHAGYILRSKIACFGDIEATKEISDSEILSDGECRVKTGKIFASSITAKQGAYIKNIGAEKAKRVILTVGTSPNYERKLKKIDKIIQNNQNELDQMLHAKNNTNNQLKELNATISHFSISLKITHEESSAIDVTDIDEINIMKNEAGEKLAELEAQKKGLEEQLEMFESAETECAKLLNKAIKDNFILKKIDKDHSPNPIVKVEGTIISGSLITGRHSKIIVNENRNKVKIIEAKSPDSDYPDKNPWRMVISDL